MSAENEFGIDIVVNPQVAAGKAAVIGALGEIEGRATKANQKIREQFEDLNTAMQRVATGGAAALESSLANIGKGGDAAVARLQEQAAAIEQARNRLVNAAGLGS